MAFPNPFIRLTLKWTLADGEIAQSNCSWDPGIDVPPLDEATADAFEAAALSFWNDIIVRYSAYTKYVGCSMSLINVDGSILSRIDRPTSGISGTAGSGPLPNEVAAVMSLRTAMAGRRTRGRMYLPGPAVSQVDVDARYQPGFGTDVAPAGANFLQPLVVGSVTWTAAVASATGGLLTPVTAVAVGNVPDVQRRRRDTQLEAYEVAPL